MCKFKIDFKIFFLSLLALISASCSYKNKITASNIQLDPIYGSNMVFNNNDSIIIKGYCSPNGLLAVKLQDGLKYFNADTNGRWVAKFPPFNYKGIFRIDIEGVEQEISLENLTTGTVWVVLGDNWLIDTPVNLFGKTSLIGRGGNKNVRIYNPPSLYSKERAGKGTWTTLNNSKKRLNEIFPIILGDKLSTLNNEPIGIINLSFPGSSLKDFNGKDREHMENIYSVSERDSILSKYVYDYFRYQKIADSSFKGIEHKVLDRYYDDSEWSEVSFPQVTMKKWYLKDRIVWLRKKIYIPEKYITSDFAIDLGLIRGQFDFYFNGIHLAKFNGESKDFKLQVPDSLVKVWSNLLTVRMVAGDSLSGLYSNNPIVVNADQTYNKQIADGWRVRTHYEPSLPKVNKNSYIFPEVYSYYILPMKGLKVNSVLLAGSIHQYAGLNSNSLSNALQTINKSFNTQNSYMYLIPLPGSVDAIVNSDLYNTIRNSQLISAASENWETINTLHIKHSNSIQRYQDKMADCLLEKIKD